MIWLANPSQALFDEIWQFLFGMLRKRNKSIVLLNLIFSPRDIESSYQPQRNMLVVFGICPIACSANLYCMVGLPILAVFT